MLCPVHDRYHQQLPDIHVGHTWQHGPSVLLLDIRQYHKHWHKSGLILSCYDAKQAQICMNGTFHFLLLQMCFDESCSCWWGLSEKQPDWRNHSKCDIADYQLFTKKEVNK